MTAKAAHTGQLIIAEVALSDVGLTDWKLVECVSNSGWRSFWLLDPDCKGGGEAPPIPAHEELGAIPSEMQWAINSPRCGRLAPTTGIPCRQRVSFLGQPCRFHRDSKDGNR